LKEAILAQFFEGAISGAVLANDLAGSEEHASPLQSTVTIEDMQEEFVVSREMAIRLCDAVLNNQLPPDSLATIGFALMASDSFVWDGDDLLGEVISDWSCPEINYDLTLANVERFRRWLLGVEEYPTRPTLPHDSTESRLISFVARSILAIAELFSNPRRGHPVERG
jgi:hypothetical protein